MAGLTKGQAIRRLDASTQTLRDDVNKYWELAGLEEADRDRIIKATASLNRAIMSAANSEGLGALRKGVVPGCCGGRHGSPVGTDG